MTKAERTRINAIINQANQLMDGKGNGITTSDVVESILGDLHLVLCSSQPEHLAELVRLDEERSAA